MLSSSTSLPDGAARRQASSAARGSGKGPQEVALHDRIEVAAWRVGGVPLDDLDRQSATLRLRPQLRQHARREVQGRHPVALPRQEEAQETRPGAGIKHPRRRRRQQPAQRPRPDGEFGKASRIVPR